MQIACLVLPLLLLLRLLPLLLLPLDEVMHERDADADAAALSHYHVEQGFQGHSRAQRWLLALRKQLLLRHGLACFVDDVHTHANNVVSRSEEVFICPAFRRGHSEEHHDCREQQPEDPGIEEGQPRIAEDRRERPQRAWPAGRFTQLGIDWHIHDDGPPASASCR